jgi:hypothetical protein
LTVGAPSAAKSNPSWRAKMVGAVRNFTDEFVIAARKLLISWMCQFGPAFADPDDCEPWILDRPSRTVTSFADWR